MILFKVGKIKKKTDIVNNSLKILGNEIQWWLNRTMLMKATLQI